MLMWQGTWEIVNGNLPCPQPKGPEITITKLTSEGGSSDTQTGVPDDDELTPKEWKKLDGRARLTIRYNCEVKVHTFLSACQNSADV